MSDTQPLHLIAPLLTPAQISVVGVGGGGCNTVDRMMHHQVDGITTIAINTDAQALAQTGANHRLQLGNRLTQGLGSGGNPVVGQQAAEEDQETLVAALQGADMVFVTAGMGGGTGTGAAPIVAGIARDMGILTVGVVTLPFGFEGRHRRHIALHGVEQLRPVVDTLIVIPNDRLLASIGRTLPLRQAFALVDQMLLHGIQGIVDLIVRPGLINVDFADVRTIMASAGTAWMSMGRGHGTHCVEKAVQQALTSPLLDLTIAGARGVLCNITGGTDLNLNDIQAGVTTITGLVANEANIIFGATIDTSIPDDSVRVTLIATGFDQATTSTPVSRQSQNVAQPLSHPEETVAVAESRPPKTNEPPGRPTLKALETADNTLELPPFIRRRRQQRSGS